MSNYPYDAKIMNKGDPILSAGQKPEHIIYLSQYVREHPDMDKPQLCHVILRERASKFSEAITEGKINEIIDELSRSRPFDAVPFSLDGNDLITFLKQASNNRENKDLVPDEYVLNGITYSSDEYKLAPVILLPRPTLFIFDTGFSEIKFKDPHVVLKEPSTTKDPFSSDLKVWPDGQFMTLYSEHEASPNPSRGHRHGEVYWFDLVMEGFEIDRSGVQRKVELTHLLDPGSDPPKINLVDHPDGSLALGVYFLPA